MKSIIFHQSFNLAILGFFLCQIIVHASEKKNVLFIISDDLTYTALSCYGNKICKTPNIDKLAKQGTRFTQAYCQATYCGPSRASFMSGYYPHATGALGYKNPRPQIGERSTWSQHFRNHGYHAARISKIFHMGVPGGIESGEDGADDLLSWDEKYNSKGPEWRAPGDGERLYKKIQTGKNLSLEATPLLWLKRMEMISFIQMAKLQRKPSN